jgi:hypothetical protein
MSKTPPVVLSARLLVSVKAAAAVMGFSEEQIVEGGVALFCTYILHRLGPGLEEMRASGKEMPNWQSQEVVSALASSFVSARKRRLGSSGRRGEKARVSEIGSVGSVLRSLAGCDGKDGSGKASPGA